MSIFDSIKNALGGSKADADKDVTMAPSQVLRNAGIDTSRLDLSFGNNSITVGGEITDEAERDKILDLLAGLPGIDTIEDSMTVAAPEPDPEPAPEPESEPADESPAETVVSEDAPEEDKSEPETPAAEADARTYTVQSGDTLWKIAEEVYGNGSKYMANFRGQPGIAGQPRPDFPWPGPGHSRLRLRLRLTAGRRVRAASPGA